ncbi:30S ribosomal protein S3 [Candidatus Woesearchaeota archaeon]|nr:30S ribosomal protein S3 [uncultured archaeon]MBS3139409.1 30S ribosomal protein S3 [Candidatus Woesearchaeota archaeon]
MIEREFIQQKTKEYYIRKEVENTLKGAGISQVRLKKIPLGEKIIIHTSRPSLIVGSKGSNIRDLTKKLKKEFNLENPQIEIVEVKEVFLDAAIVAERIAGSLEKFGSARFKSIGHKIMENVLNSGALGIELIISGKIPGARAKSWRFYRGYLKKCGDIAIYGVRTAQKSALLKSGIIGIKVAIMPPDLALPDTIEILEHPVVEVAELTKEEFPAEEAKPKKRAARKKSPRKNEKKTEETAKTAEESAAEKVEPAAAESAAGTVKESEPEPAEEPMAIEEANKEP